MRRQVKTITKEQQQYRDSIVPPKRKVYKKRIVSVIIPEPTTRETYMGNCLFWIKEFFDGRYADRARTKRCALSLKEYCEEIIRELNSLHP